MTEEYHPTMQTWRQYAILLPDEQSRIIALIMQKAVYGGLEPKLAGRYSRLASALSSDEIRVFAEDPDLLIILNSFLSTN